MKTIRKRNTFLAAIVLAVVISCTSSQQTTEFKSIAAAETTVNAAYNAYLDMVVKGQVATNSLPQVSRAYNLFQNSANTAVVLHGLNPTNLPPSDLASLAINVMEIIRLAEGK